DPKRQPPVADPSSPAGPATPATPATPANPANPGGKGPAASDDPASKDLTSDLAALRTKLHVAPNADGNGHIRLSYKFTNDAECADFVTKDCEMCERDTRSGKGLLISVVSNSTGWVFLSDVVFKGD